VHLEHISFPVSRETEQYEGARERFSLMLLLMTSSTDLKRPLARLLAFTEILAQKREIFFELIQRFTVRLCREFIAYQYEDMIHIKE
jgi:hypothetical protein